MKTSFNLFCGTVLAVCVSLSGLGQSTDWSGAFSTEGDNYQTLWDMQPDNDGNIILCGEFRLGDFSIGGVDVEQPGSVITDGYVAKIDENKNALWVKAVGGAGVTGSVLTAVASDMQGNTYLAGYFLSFAGVGLGIDDFEIPAEGGFSQTYMVKLDPDGVAIWEKHFNDPDAVGSNTNRIYNIQVDSNNDVVINGSVSSTMVFGDTMITDIGGGDSFIAKCDSDGNFIWVRSIGGIDGDRCGGFTLNANDEIFASGTWAGDTLWAGDLFVVNPAPLANDNFDRWIAKYSSDGTPIWLNREGGPDNEWGSSLAANQTGGVLVMSRAATAVTINEIEYSNVAALVSQYNLEGGVETPVSLMECDLIEELGTQYERAPGQITTDGAGNFYILQTFLSEECVVAGDIVLENAGGNAGTRDFAVVKIDSDGNVIWANSAGGMDNDSGNSLIIDANESLIAGGNFSSFELPIGDTILENLGSPEPHVFAAYIDLTTTGLFESNPSQPISVYPNPTTDFVKFNLNQATCDEALVNIYSPLGKLVKSESVPCGNEANINIESLKPGLYQIEINQDNTRFTGKFVITK